MIPISNILKVIPEKLRESSCKKCFRASSGHSKCVSKTSNIPTSTNIKVQSITPCSSEKCYRKLKGDSKLIKKNVHWRKNIATWILMTNSLRFDTSKASSVYEECCCCPDFEISEDAESIDENHEYESICCDESDVELVELQETSEVEESGISDCKSTTFSVDSYIPEETHRDDLESFNYYSTEVVVRSKETFHLYTENEALIEKKSELEKVRRENLVHSQSLPLDSNTENEYESVEDSDFLTYPYLMRSPKNVSNIYVKNNITSANKNKSLKINHPYNSALNSSFKEAFLTQNRKAVFNTPKRGNYAKFFIKRSEEELKCLQSPLVYLLPRDDTSATILLACWLNDIDYLEGLWNKNSFNPYICDYIGASCFHYAARGGHLEILKFITEKVALLPNFSCQDSDVPKSFVGATPLHDAASLGHLEVLQYLSKIWPNSLWMTDEEGSSVMEVAAR